MELLPSTHFQKMKPWDFKFQTRNDRLLQTPIWNLNKNSNLSTSLSQRHENYISNKYPARNERTSGRPTSNPLQPVNCENGAWNIVLCFIEYSLQIFPRLHHVIGVLHRNWIPFLSQSLRFNEYGEKTSLIRFSFPTIISDRVEGSFRSKKARVVIKNRLRGKVLKKFSVNELCSLKLHEIILFCSERNC